MKNSSNSRHSQLLNRKLMRLRQFIEIGNLAGVKALILRYPSVLSSTINKPSVLRADRNYTAAHMCALFDRSEILEFILLTVACENFSTHFISKPDRALCKMVDNLILDYYLNLPDQMAFETPLHMASRNGFAAVVKVLVSFVQCVPSPNAIGQYPKDVICASVKNPDPAVYQEIMELLSERYIVPVWRAIDNSVAPYIGDPIPVNSVPEVRKDSPMHPELEIRAFAGPLSLKDAKNFHLRWKAPPRKFIYASTNQKSSSSMLSLQLPLMHEFDLNRSRMERHIKNSDFEKGLEVVGRKLAVQQKVRWIEFWDFLQKFENLTSKSGLKSLETYLEKGLVRKSRAYPMSSAAKQPGNSASLEQGKDNAKLYNIFIFGEIPTKRDNDVLKAVIDVNVKKRLYPLVFAWKNALLAYTAEERSAFPVKNNYPKLVISNKPRIFGLMRHYVKLYTNTSVDDNKEDQANLRAKQPCNNMPLGYQFRQKMPALNVGRSALARNILQKHRSQSAWKNERQLEKRAQEDERKIVLFQRKPRFENANDVTPQSKFVVKSEAQYDQKPYLKNYMRKYVVFTDVENDTQAAIYIRKDLNDQGLQSDEVSDKDIFINPVFFNAKRARIEEKLKEHFEQKLEMNKDLAKSSNEDNNPKPVAVSPTPSNIEYSQRLKKEKNEIEHNKDMQKKVLISKPSDPKQLQTDEKEKHPPKAEIEKKISNEKIVNATPKHSKKFLFFYENEVKKKQAILDVNKDTDMSSKSPNAKSPYSDTKKIVPTPPKMYLGRTECPKDIVVNPMNLRLKQMQSDQNPKAKNEQKMPDEEKDAKVMVMSPKTSRDETSRTDKNHADNKSKIPIFLYTKSLYIDEKERKPKTEGPMTTKMNLCSKRSFGDEKDKPGTEQEMQVETKGVVAAFCPKRTHFSEDKKAEDEKNFF